MKTLSGTVMFPYLQTSIQAVLPLSHGNTDVERSLAVSRQVIRRNSTLELLAQESLNGIRDMKDAVTAKDKIYTVDFNKELMSCTRKAND